MNALNPTSKKLRLDEKGRPYFLWDEETSLDDFIAGLRDEDPDVRSYLAAKLMRQAKPDGVFTFLPLQEIRELWPRAHRYLVHSRRFWSWLLESWKEPLDGSR